MATKKFNSTKEYLGQIIRLEKMIQNKLSEADRLRRIAYNVPAIKNKEKVQTSGNDDKLGDSVAKIIDLENEINRNVEELSRVRKKIIAEIESIEDVNMYHVLAGRYILERQMCDIQSELGCSYMQINRIHGMALKEFEKKYGREYLREK